MVNRLIKYVSVVFALLTGPIGLCQDFLDLNSNPRHIAQYEILERLNSIDAYSLSQYMSSQDNWRRASDEEREQLSFFTQLMQFLQNVPGDKISYAYLSQYYHPILVASIRKLYESSFSLQSLSDGRPVQFDRIEKDFNEADGWNKYLVFQKDRELLSLMATFAGSMIDLRDKMVMKKGAESFAIISSAGSLHLIEYRLFGNDRMMSRIDPYPLALLKSVFPKKYSTFLNESYIGETIYDLLIDSVNSGELWKKADKRDSILYLYLFLPPASNASIGELIYPILFPGLDMEMIEASLAKAFSKRYGIDTKTALSIVNLGMLQSNINTEELSKISQDPFSNLRDSLYLAGHSFAEDLPYVNVETHKDDSLFREYDAAFFNRIITDLQSQFNSNSYQVTSREKIEYFLKQRYGSQDLNQVFSIMIDEVVRISETENNPRAINGLVNLVKAAELFDFASFPLITLFSRLIQTDINTAKRLYNNQLAKYLQYLKRAIGIYPEAQEEYVVANAALASMLSDADHLQLVSKQELTEMTEYALNNLNKLPNDHIRAQANLWVASALTYQGRLEEAELLLDQTNYADNQELFYSYIKFRLSQKRYSYKDGLEEARSLATNHIDELSTLDVYEILHTAYACKDEELVKICALKLNDNSDVLSDLIWCDSYTRNLLYSKYRYDSGLSLLLTTLFLPPRKDLFADVMYNYALATKGALLKSEHLVLQNILNNSDERVKKVFTTKSSSIGGRLIDSITNEWKDEFFTTISRKDYTAFNVKGTNNTDVRQSLLPGEVAVEFIYYTVSGSDVCAVIEKPEYEHSVIVDIDLFTFTRKYGDVNNPDIYYDRKVMQALSDCVWGPVKEYLKEGETVYYSMDGALNFINSEALPYDKVRTLGMVYDMRRVSTTAVKPRDLFISDIASASLFGGISVEGEDNISESTMREIKELSSLLRKSGKRTELLTGKNARKESLASKSGADMSLLHISTHGYKYEYAYGSNLKQYGLSLADGLFTAEDVSQLDLVNTKAVFLSACDSGGGIVGDDSVFGLQRGFKQAGAGTIVMALWPVEAEFTESLMIRIYTYFCNGLSLKEAFNAAVNESRRDSESSDWAAFVMLD